MDNFIDLEQVKRQFAEINRPGDWSVISTESVPRLKDELIINFELPTVPMTFDRICSSPARG